MKRVTVSIPVPSGEWLKSVWPCLFAAFLLFPSLLWIAEDRRIWPWDQAWYAEVSVDCWYWMNHSLVNWLHTVADGLNLKPPAIAWIGQFFVPLKDVFGSVELSLLIFIVLTQLVLLLFIFRIGAIMSSQSRLAAVVACVFAAGGQLFVGLSHQYFVEPLQAVAVAWAFFVALKAPEWSRTRIILHVAGNLAIGLLIKASTPAYCWPAWLYCLFVLYKKRSDSPFLPEWKSAPWTLAISAGVSVVLCAFWYLRHMSEVWMHVRDSSFGQVALDYGTRDTFLHKAGIWLSILARSFLSPYLGWIFALAVCAAAASVLWRHPPLLRDVWRITPITSLAVLQLVSLLFLFSINIGVDARYTYAMLPCMAIILIKVFTALPRNALFALLVLCGWRWVIVNRASFAPVNEIENQSEWVYQPQRDRTDFDELARVVRLTSTLPGRYNIVAVESPRLNLNSAAFFAAKNRLVTGVRSEYTSIGYAQKDVDAAMRRIEEFKAPYVLSLDSDSQDPTPNFLNIVARPVLDRLTQAKRFVRVPFVSKRGIVVFEFRPDPLTAAATAAVQPAGPPVDLAVMPPEIAQAKLEKRGASSLDYVNSALAKEKGGGRIFVVPGGDIVSCIGWAYDDLKKSTPENAWLELTGIGATQHYYWPLRRYDRPELAASVKLPSVKRAGFNCQQVNFRLPAGTYTARIYQLDGGTAVVSDLNTYNVSPAIIVN